MTRFMGLDKALQILARADEFEKNPREMYAYLQMMERYAGDVLAEHNDIHSNHWISVVQGLALALACVGDRRGVPVPGIPRAVEGIRFSGRTVEFDNRLLAEFRADIDRLRMLAAKMAFGENEPLIPSEFRTTFLSVAGASKLFPFGAKTLKRRIDAGEVLCIPNNETGTRTRYCFDTRQIEAMKSLKDSSG